MVKKFLVLLKYPIVIVAILVGIISCEKDFKNIGEELLDENLFTAGNYSALIKAHSVKINGSKTSGMEMYLLGYTTNDQFGSLRASVVTQLTLPTPNPSFGLNAVIDSVVITIPYTSTLLGKIDIPNPADATKTIKAPDFKLDSVFTSGAGENFDLKVYELGTYLNALNPNDPFKANEIFSNQVFQKTGTPFYSGLIKPNRKDTMMVINRYRYADNTLTNRVIYKKDTVKLTNSKPFINIPLDKQKIKQIFQDNANSAGFTSNENFKHYFRGLYLDAANSGNGTALMYLMLSEANMTIYFSETEIKDETAEQDLNENGIKGEQDVAVGTARSFVYGFTGIKANLFEHNYNGTIAENYLINPNIASGDKKLFVQGAAGSDAVIRLFGDDNTEIENLRTKPWLINDAKLYLYVDPSNTSNQYPEKLYLYGIKDGLKLQTYEIMKQGPSMFGGDLVLDTDSIPDYYLFHLTDYVSEVLKSNAGDELIRDFGIKVYDPYDTPISASDTILRPYNNYFKGVILTGNDSDIQTRKLKLEIFYTEKK